MKCRKCGLEISMPPKWGKYRNGVQKYRCRFCGKFFPDPTEYAEWEKRRKHSPSPRTYNGFDQYIACVIYFTLKSKRDYAINGIGSSRSIAALIDCLPSTVQYWLKKYKNSGKTINDLKQKITALQFFDFIATKQYGNGILNFFVGNLPSDFFIKDCKHS